MSNRFRHNLLFQKRVPQQHEAYIGGTVTYIDIAVSACFNHIRAPVLRVTDEATAVAIAVQRGHLAGLQCHMYVYRGDARWRSMRTALWIDLVSRNFRVYGFSHPYRSVSPGALISIRLLPGARPFQDSWLHITF
ncbi:hypothetical protein FIBSPDRAFT_1054644 [Athelia psychrophila]|uniref:Uncharacterized protein n=1 Tax=Athelia psychrophila TaxID=1759441 RepID=A0A167UZT7_9AGAM|nr:hypothetical protein FIBSPDRAFT_1054644 [Fibularhizoctonia sp. CBS 109695]